MMTADALATSGLAVLSALLCLALTLPWWAAIQRVDEESTVREVLR